MFGGEVGGEHCAFCALWIHDTGDWFCEECAQATCSRCGRFDDEDEVFLCPECFLKEGPDSE